jgi:predicted small secreted protein
MNSNEEKKGHLGRCLYVAAWGMHLAMLLGMQACNTTEGLGQDVQNLGENIEEEADEHK